MRKKISFILAIALTLALFTLITLPSYSSREQIVVARVIDGDTFVGEDGRTFRLSNINTPEKSTYGAEEAKRYLSLFEGAQVAIESLGTDKYGRTLVRLYAPEYVNHELVAQGLAVKFLVEETEAEAFANAEVRAIEEQNGIWKHSPYFGCISSRIEEKEEFVVLHSVCGALNIKGWIIRDESRKSYSFKENIITEVVIYTGKGTDNKTAIFWDSSTPIWNNDRDTLYLLDSEGRIVHNAAYGYR